MAEDPANDDTVSESGLPRTPDPFGHASLLIVESLIHGLVANGAIFIKEAVEIVEIAAEVKTDIGAQLGDSSATLRKSLGLIKYISDSLRHDLPAV